MGTASKMTPRSFFSNYDPVTRRNAPLWQCPHVDEMNILSLLVDVIMVKWSSCLKPKVVFPGKLLGKNTVQNFNADSFGLY